ncbi:hypothetical protein GOV04_05010 [Candidatus Woesearchaeota archaeon]|nr:hypothetical protein [Candidatus Woesearchaeota archaeon]
MKKITLLVLASLLLASIVSALPWRPSCIMEEVPSFLNFNNETWYEDYDSSNRQDYCVYPLDTVYTGNITQRFNDTIFIAQEVGFNTNGNYFTYTNPDFWTIVQLTEKSNVRNVEVYFEYYFPSYNGFCLPNTINPVTGFYESPQAVLLTNAESNLSITGTFDDAIYYMNGNVVCDQWNNFSRVVTDFSNDRGSSFSSASKTIGSLGFELKNVYLRNIEIRGSTETIEVWK